MTKSSPPPEAAMSTLPPGPRLPSGVAIVDSQTERIEPSEEDVLRHADPVQRLLYRRINELSDSLSSPMGSIAHSASTLDEVKKQLPMLGRQMGNLQMQVSSLVQEARARNSEDKSNWELLRSQTSAIRSELTLIKTELTDRMERIEIESKKFENEIRAEIQALWGKVEELSDADQITGSSKIVK
jgi:chromosome segregation ATPase